MIKLIFGLANPHKYYKYTRHNAGAWYLRLLAKNHRQFFTRNSKFSGYTSSILIENKNVHLLKSDSYMNLSGEVLLKFSNFLKIHPNHILVAHDDLSLPPGRVKLQLGGGHAGHNGMKDIFDQLNSKDFYRLRIGIGHPGKKSEVVNFVLSPPSISEKKIISRVLSECVICTNLWFQNNFEYIRNRLNGFR